MDPEIIDEITPEMQAEETIKALPDCEEYFLRRGGYITEYGVTSETGAVVDGFGVVTAVRHINVYEPVIRDGEIVGQAVTGTQIVVE
jgi:hypothetical protein